MEKMTLPEPECPEYNALMREYSEKAYPILERLKAHLRDCEQCRQYLLQNRDVLALLMLGITDEELEGKMKTG